MSLADRLKEFTVPVQADSYLASVWRNFSRTEAYEALNLALSDIEQAAIRHLLDPATDDRGRAHAAGQVFALQRLRATAHAAVNFNPDTADYGLPDDEDAPPPGGPDVPPDPFTVI